jgi:hypothetical protein
LLPDNGPADAICVHPAGGVNATVLFAWNSAMPWSPFATVGTVIAGLVEAVPGATPVTDTTVTGQSSA